MSSVLVNVLKQAFKTFDRSNQAAFNNNFSVLKQLTEKLKLQDLHLTKEFCESSFQGPDKAPCAYIHIFENDIVSMSVFILRAGYTMPLHDHPYMHGLLRGIEGTLRVQSYTQKLKADEPLYYDRTCTKVLAYAEEACHISTDTETAILTPTDRNFHEITALEDGIAAFFDILSPPYDADIPEYGRRRCQFYQPTSLPDAKEKNLFVLERIPNPVTYFCEVSETPKTVTECVFLYSKTAYSMS